MFGRSIYQESLTVKFTFLFHPDITSKEYYAFVHAFLRRYKKRINPNVEFYS
jgi:hypothetical protein